MQTLLSDEAELHDDGSVATKAAALAMDFDQNLGDNTKTAALISMVSREYQNMLLQLGTSSDVEYKKGSRNVMSVAGNWAQMSILTQVGKIEPQNMDASVR